MLQESKNIFRAMTENAHDAIVVLKEDGRCYYANKQAREISGYDELELAAVDFRQISPQADFSKAFSMCWKQTGDEQPSGCIETKLIHKQGRKLWIESSTSRTVWGKNPAVLLIFRDITARRLNQEKLINFCNELKSRIEKRDLKLKKAIQELGRKHRELSRLKIQGERINNELLETDKAVSTLAKNINQHRIKAQKALAATLNFKILPLVEYLREKESPDDLKVGLDILDAHLQTLALELRGENKPQAKLTPSELQIATMIKNGLTSREIADRCHISLQTVKTHRRNIRKKLNIHTPGASLTAYLTSLLD